MAERAKTKDIKDYLAELPQAIRLDGGGQVTLREMTAADRDAVLTFARSLPAEDLLFLRIDITEPEVVDEWVQNLKRGRTVTVLAEGPRDEGIVGYGSLHHNEANWMRHLGEIRIQVSSSYRGKGLGKRLAAAMFDAARALGLQKLSARMTPDQQSARATFERLGFEMEALLADFVMDRDGRTRDMLIMSHDVNGLTDRA